MNFLSFCSQRKFLSLRLNLNSDNHLPLWNMGDVARHHALITKKRLMALEIENNDNYLEFGVKNLGLGFPILIKRDKSNVKKVIKAPLFIWNLDFEKSTKKPNTWIIRKNEDNPIKLNELLISHLEADEKIQLKKIDAEMISDGVLDKKEILTLCNRILKQLNGQSELADFNLARCPEKQEAENIPGPRGRNSLGRGFWEFMPRKKKQSLIH